MMIAWLLIVQVFVSGALFELPPIETLTLESCLALGYELSDYYSDLGFTCARVSIARVHNI